MEDPNSQGLEEGFGNGADHDDDDDKLQNSVVTTSAQPEELQLEQQQVVQPLTKQNTRRFAALDAFRGLTVVLIILVDDAGRAYPWFDHSAWNRCALANFLLPFSLFSVGAAIALALKRIPEIKAATRKIIKRTLKLIFWGILLQGRYPYAPFEQVYGVDMSPMRRCGIDLQKIALVYLVVALIETLTMKTRASSLKPGLFSIFTAYKWQWVGGFVSFVIYTVTAYSPSVPNGIFVGTYGFNRAEGYKENCGMTGHLGPVYGVVGYVDRHVWGITQLYTLLFWGQLRASTWFRPPFGPEGLLSSTSAIITGTIGIHYGHVLIHFKEHGERLKQWVSMGVVLIALASVLHFTDAIPMNRELYSFSYVCFTSGAAGIVFSALYILVEVWGYRTTFVFLEWIGVNAMLVIILMPQGIFEIIINAWYFRNE